MSKFIKKIGYILFIVLITFPSLSAQQQNGMPPAPVIIDKIMVGTISPERNFIGTVYYHEVSNVASEIEGIVENVAFEEGQRVRQGDILVKLNTDLLEKKIKSTIASHEEVLAEIKKESIDLIRAEELYRKNFLSAQEYDQQRFKLMSLQKKALSIEAEVERLQVELQKKIVTSPFSGVIVEKTADSGEWIAPGTTVATIAKDDLVDVVVEVPEKVVKAVSPGLKVKVKVGGIMTEGKVFAIIPKGDIATRTFPIKIRMTNTLSLFEGMKAIVTLPEGKKKETFIVLRDAVVTSFGKSVIFTVPDSTAKMVPVEITGYSGMKVGVNGNGLQEGMNVVIKGNERLQDGQKVFYK